ncbi:putative GNAT family N-acyltransferase [Scopulibacillus daqui]|uniref:GNAT family N-acyltransferase n=1 Tax=Scopulibacillus daqui TaxID=1469162 RepID=A0ABS2PVH4_9BACL|nr:GNAT family N-acetyltransferase [Scopulibacillus daqui]MBM7644056.1 putative GNAT family N-acyltransferase [Scopulibacillus daqui]
MNVLIADTEDRFNDALTVRHKVFVEEQKVPEEEEIDQHEKDAVHFVAYDGKNPIGAGRMRIHDDIAKVERICVLDAYRGKHVGQAIMNKIEETAKEKGLNTLLLNAQLHAVPFYERLHYKVTSDEFMDAGIPHVQMRKSL